MRGYKDQFEPDVVNQIESIVSRLENISYPTGSSRFYGLDLALCLKSGALAGSMIIASALIEIFVRGLVIRYAEDAQSGWSRKIEAEKELESMRNLSFSKLLDNLTEVDLFCSKDAIEAKDIYKNIRIPTHHGLPARLLGRGKNDPFSSIMSLLGKSSTVSMSEFEDFIECEAIPIINNVVSIIENNQYTDQQNT